MADKAGRTDALILALARGNTIRAAAKMSGYSERQAHRLASDPAIKANVAAVRSGLISQAVGMLAATSADAAKAMGKLLTDKSATVRLAASKAVLETAVKLRDATEIEERLTALEARIRQNTLNVFDEGKHA